MKKKKKKKSATAPSTVSNGVKFLGISFTDTSHLAYFLISWCIFFGAAIAGHAVRHWLFMGLAYSYFLTAVMTAIVATRFGQRSTRRFTPTCIWWNMVMALICSTYKVWVLMPITPPKG